MQVETPEVGADKATTPRYDTFVVCGLSGETIPQEIAGGEVVAWSLGHGLAAMDALEEFVDDLAAGNCKQPVHLTQGAADALNLMRRRRAIGWSADEPTAEAPADWRTAVARAESMARRVFGENNDDAMQAVDYMAGLLLACEPETMAPQQPFMFTLQEDGNVRDWTQDESLAEEWRRQGHEVAKLYTSLGGAV